MARSDTILMPDFPAETVEDVYSSERDEDSKQVPSERRPRVIPIASGKGGVGKTVLTANLGAALAAKGKSVILADLDLGGSNLHSLLGVENTRTGIGGYAHKDVRSLDQVVSETQYDGLRLIAGDALLPGTANIPWWFKKRLMTEFSTLDAHYILIDLGAGTSFNTVDFFLASPLGCIVSNPEPTALVNAYSFLKNAYFRAIARLFSAKSPERRAVLEWAHKKREDSSGDSETLPRYLDRAFPGAGHGEKAEAAIAGMTTMLVMNDIQSADEEKSWQSLVSVADRNLSISLELMATLPHDPLVRKAVFARASVYAAAAGSPFSLAVGALADKLISTE